MNLAKRGMSTMNENMNEKEPSVELRLQDLLLAYLHKWKAIVVCMLVCGILAWGFTYFCVTPMYRTGIKIYVSNYIEGEDVVIQNDRLTNADVSATGSSSMTGKLNLQFASSATLVPMEYKNLHNGTNTNTNTNTGTN